MRLLQRALFILSIRHCRNASPNLPLRKIFFNPTFGKINIRVELYAFDKVAFVNQFHCRTIVNADGHFVNRIACHSAAIPKDKLEVLRFTSVRPRKHKKSISFRNKKSKMQTKLFFVLFAR